MCSLQDQDPSLLNDFVTESRELIETVDQDLVTLEQSPEDPELLNRIFRALHTIKGSSSFLALEPVTRFAHAGEDALNALRKAEAAVTADMMDMLLRAVDVIRDQLDEVESGEAPQAGPDDLIEGLHRIGEEGVQRNELREDEGETPDADDAFTLPPAKQDLLQYMIEDLMESLDQLEAMFGEAVGHEDTEQLSHRMKDITDGLVRSAGFFEVDTLSDEVQTLHKAALALGELDAQAIAPLVAHVNTLVDAVRHRAEAMNAGKLRSHHCDGVCAQIIALIAGEPLPDPKANEPKKQAETEADDRPAAVAQPDKPTAHVAERTVRVDVERLEAMLNLVGELVLQKNRVLGAARNAQRKELDGEFCDQLTQVGSDLERVTADLQTSVMKTRMQPLSKLFNRYPRLIRDLSRTMGKRIDLEIIGGETEVDKSVIESLGDPLVHLLRNSADHGLEGAEERAAAGKDPRGKIQIVASQEGNHVLVQIIDDGRGLNTEKIGKKAVERGLVSAEKLESMSRAELHNLIFQPGFSTAEVVSDVSGRGVGMDVVRTNIAKLNGIVEIQSNPDKGSTVSIRIPLTVAIMPAMVVEVGGGQYALPLASILEILRPEQAQVSTVGREPMLRVRENVLPIVILADHFGQRSTESNQNIAVIVGMGEKRLALMVDGLIGQEEVVIKPLDDTLERDPSISGATIREDGGVSLIIDIATLFKTLDRRQRYAA